MKKKVLIIGSANMDTTLYVKAFPKDGEAPFVKSKFIQPGGKGANQAVAAAKSGLVESNFVGAVGDDEDGKNIIKILKENGVKTSVKLSKEPTGSALIYVNDSSLNEIHISVGANKDVLANDLTDKMFENCNVVLLQNEIPETTNLKAMKMAHKNDAKVIFNPAPCRKISNDIYQYIDIFVVNEDEMEFYSGEKDVYEGAKKLLDLGLKKVLITLGEKGSILFEESLFYRVRAIKVKAIDTVAAGDTYIGYFASAISNNYTDFDAMKIATRASSITVSRKGSMVSIPFGKEVLAKK